MPSSRPACLARPAKPTRPARPARAATSTLLLTPYYVRVEAVLASTITTLSGRSLRLRLNSAEAEALLGLAELGNFWQPYYGYSDINTDHNRYLIIETEITGQTSTTVLYCQTFFTLLHPRVIFFSQYDFYNSVHYLSFWRVVEISCSCCVWVWWVMANPEPELISCGGWTIEL